MNDLTKQNSARPGEHLINGIDPYDFTREEHGKTTIFSKEIPWAPCIFVAFLFNTGASNDPQGKEGLTHFLEHLLFSGTPTYPSKFEIDQFSKINTLDSLNAFTSFGHVALHFRCLAEHLEPSLKGTHEMLTASLLKEEDVEREKGIITQEAWGVYKNETRIAFLKKYRRNRYQSLPHRVRLFSPLGWPDTIAKIEQQDVSQMYKDILVRENLSVIITGKITAEHIGLLKSCIDQLPNGKKADSVFVPDTIKAPNDPISINTYDEMGVTPSNQAHVEISSFIPKHHNSYTTGTESITEALMRELLFRELRHKKNWCYGVKADFSDREDYAYGEIGANIDPLYVNEAIDVMEQIIHDVIDGKHQKEFYQEKELFIERKRAAEITGSSIVEHVIGSLRMDGKIENRKESFEKLHAVTYDDVCTCLKRIYRETAHKLYEISVPNGYDKAPVISHLQKYLK